MFYGRLGAEGERESFLLKISFNVDFLNWKFQHWKVFFFKNIFIEN